MIGKWKLIRSFKKHRIFPKIYFLWSRDIIFTTECFSCYTVYLVIIYLVVTTLKMIGYLIMKHDTRIDNDGWKRSPEVRKWLRNSRFSYLLVCCPSDTIAESLPQQRSQFQPVANALNHSWSVKYILGIHCIYN